MREQLFDCADEYEAMLNKGISLSGESQEYFVKGRILDLHLLLPTTPVRILDFGCGLGKTSIHLANTFTGAHVTGVDLSGVAVEHARSSRIDFGHLDDLPAMGRFGICGNREFDMVSNHAEDSTGAVPRPSLSGPDNRAVRQVVFAVLPDVA